MSPLEALCLYLNTALVATWVRTHNQSWALNFEGKKQALLTKYGSPSIVLCIQVSLLLSYLCLLGLNILFLLTCKNANCITLSYSKRKKGQTLPAVRQSGAQALLMSV